MNKINLLLLALSFYGCAVPVSIGNSSIEEPIKSENNKSNTVYAKNGKTMVAINHILPQRAGQFEMLTKTIILPAIKREDIEVYESLKFLVPEDVNDDGTLTFMFIADPYLEQKSYDIFEILVQQFGRERAEDYFDRWITCFAYDQEVISFR